MSEPKMIDANALTELIKSVRYDRAGRTVLESRLVDAACAWFAQLVETFQPVDTVPVVRCNQMMDLDKALIAAYNDGYKQGKQDAVVHGHWIDEGEDDGNGNHLFRCSECGHSDTHMKILEVPHCWFCGAKMGAQEGIDK